MPKIMDIEGIGPKYAEQLIKSRRSYNQCIIGERENPQRRQDLSKATYISEALILQWVNHADLFGSKVLVQIF
jgi:hypothetical protein